MKKIIILLIFLLCFCIGFLTGFFYGRLPTPTLTPVDSDNDGYPDTVDDGPYDPRYHEKNKTAELKLHINEPWTKKELTPSIGSQYTGIFITIYTSGPDIDAELFTQSKDNISSVWNYHYNGMDPDEPHEYFYFFTTTPQEQFNKLVITNPTPSDSYSVTIILYTLR